MDVITDETEFGGELVSEQENSIPSIWLREVAGTEEALLRLQSDVQTMLANPEVSIAQVIRKKTELVETQAYLKGLNFMSPMFVSR